MRKFRLKLETLTEDDNGNYTCVAANKYGQIERTFSLEAVGKYI
jgi:hypothetical protein